MKRSILGHAAAYAAVTALAIGGTAQALPGRNTVTSDDIKNGQVKRPDIRNNAVNGAKVADGSVTGADVNEGSLKLGCLDGTIKASAKINGYAAPATFGTGGWVVEPYNCSGGTIEVSKPATGQYIVRVNGVNASGVQVTVAQGNVASSIGTAFEDVNGNWRVGVSDAAGAAEDRYFYIIVY